jgi:hypothetical protein
MNKLLNIKYFTKIGILIFFILIAFAAPAKAQNLSLMIDPLTTTIVTTAPSATISPIKIQNMSDTLITLQIQLKSFKAKGENGEIEYLNNSSEIFNNIQILDQNMPVKTIILGPKQQKILNLNLNVPSDIKISDYYFSVVFVSIDASPVKSTSSVNQIGIATNFLITVGYPKVSKITLEEFSSNALLGKGPVPFNVRIKNVGNHFTTLKGQIDIKNIFGQSVGKYNFENINILSKSIRSISNKIDTKDLGLNNFLLGRYSLTLNFLTYDKEIITSKTIYFFAFPFETLTIIAALIILITIIRNKFKNYTNKGRI